MPELPGPPSDYDEQQRRAWFKGAATIARLQSDQWAILAKQYEQAVDGGADADDEADDEDGPGLCPECGGERVEGLGGPVCLECD